MSCQSHSLYVCKLPCFYSAICMWGALVKINSLGSHWWYFEFFWETFRLFLYEWFNTDPIYESISQIWSRADAYLIVVNYPSLQQSLKQQDSVALNLLTLWFFRQACQNVLYLSSICHFGSFWNWFSSGSPARDEARNGMSLSAVSNTSKTIHQMYDETAN